MPNGRHSLSNFASRAGRDAHNIQKRVVFGMLRVRLLCEVRNFSPITRSRTPDAPPGLDQPLSPKIATSPSRIHARFVVLSRLISRRMATSAVTSVCPDLRGGVQPGARFVPLSSHCEPLHSLELRALDSFSSYRGSNESIPDERAPPRRSVQTYRTIGSILLAHTQRGLSQCLNLVIPPLPLAPIQV